MRPPACAIPHDVSLLVCLLLAAALAAVACGSEVTLPDGSAGSTAQGGAGLSGGGGSVSTSASGGGMNNPCAGTECGTRCTVCNDVECLQGICDGRGSCGPPEIVACGAGGRGGSGNGGAPGCPPAAEVVSGEACDLPEDTACPSETSCSGQLNCSDGVWTLFELC